MGSLLARPLVAAPQLKVDPTVWNFGKVTNISELSHEFTLRNVGDEPLEISQLVQDCGACLTSSIEQPRILPGGRAVLKSRIDLRASKGSLFHSVSFKSNDPAQPMVTIFVTGEVVPAFRVEPAEMRLDLSAGSPVAGVDIVPLLPLRASLSLVECSNTNIVLTLARGLGNRFTLTAQALATLPRGYSALDLRVRSPDPEDPACLVRLLISHPPDFEVFPPELRFSALEEPQTRILWIRQRGSAPLILLDAVPSTDKYRCEIDPDPTGYNYKIYVTAAQLKAGAGQTNTLILKLRDSRQQEKSVPVALSVSQPNSNNP